MHEHEAGENELVIYGASDDLIEVGGALRAEWGVGELCEYLAFDGGALVSIEYTKEGLWRVHMLAQGNAAQVAKVEATDPDGDYTDCVTLRYAADSVPKWVLCGCDLVGGKA